MLCWGRCGRKPTKKHTYTCKPLSKVFDCIVFDCVGGARLVPKEIVLLICLPEARLASAQANLILESNTTTAAWWLVWCSIVESNLASAHECSAEEDVDSSTCSNFPWSHHEAMMASRVMNHHHVIHSWAMKPSWTMRPESMSRIHRVRHTFAEYEVCIILARVALGTQFYAHCLSFSFSLLHSHCHSHCLSWLGHWFSPCIIVCPHFSSSLWNSLSMYNWLYNKGKGRSHSSAISVPQDTHSD